MLDLTGILISSVIMLIVIVRAAQLDSSSPWFERAPNPEGRPSDLDRIRANAAAHMPAWRKLKR